MEVILKKNFKKLGYKDDIVDVAAGYARNYLIPNNIVIVATPTNKKIAKENLKQAQVKIAKQTAEAQNIANKLSDMKFDIVVKTDKGKIVSEISTSAIANAINDKTNYHIHKKDISFHSQIKTLGETSVRVKLYRNIECDVKLNIVEQSK